MQKKYGGMAQCPILIEVKESAWKMQIGKDVRLVEAPKACQKATQNESILIQELLDVTSGLRWNRISHDLYSLNLKFKMQVSIGLGIIRGQVCVKAW